MIRQTGIGPTHIYRDALIDAREQSTDALLALDDALSFIEADDDADFPGEVGRFLARERRRAIQTVLAQRDQLAEHHPDLRGTDDEQYAAWRELACRVREQVELPRVFERANYQLHPAGHNRRRDVDEWAGACPLCGGTDRLRVWAGPNGLAWCRRWRWSGDAVAVAMSLRQVAFRDAVRWLAGLAGLAVPPTAKTSRRLRVREVRHA